MAAILYPRLQWIIYSPAYRITFTVGDLGAREGEVAGLPTLQELPATFLLFQLALKYDKDRLNNLYNYSQTCV